MANQELLIPSDIGNYIYQIKRSIQKTSKDLDKYAKEEQKFYKNVSDELEYIAKSSVDKYYDSYEPYVYNDEGKYGFFRKYRLYDVYKITVNSDKWSITYDYDDLGYGGLNEYIFNTMFKGGWHGGADKGNGHPEPGTPYWREPVVKKGRYYFTKSSPWQRPAVRTESPYEMIEKRAQKYLESAMDEYDREIYNKAEKSIDDTLNKIENFMTLLGG